MNIDGIKVYNQSDCIFNSSGYHTVYVLMNLDPIPNPH